MSRGPTKPSIASLGSDQRLGDKSSDRIFRGRRTGTGGTDPTAVHVGDAAGGDVGGTFPLSLTVAGLTSKQPLDATLTAIATLVTAPDKLIYATGVDTFALADFTATARSLIDDTSFAAMRTTLGLAIGVDVQAFDAATVKGPASAVADNLASYNGTTGKLIKDSGAKAANVPADGEKAALAGTFGTPGVSNKYVTGADPSFDYLLRFTTLAQLLLALAPDGYWSLGSGGGGATDQGAGGHNLTAQGGVTVGGGTSLVIDGTTSTLFDGVNDYLSSAYQPFVSGSKRTFVGWYSNVAGAASRTLIGQDTTPGFNLSVASDTSGFSNFALQNGGSIVNWNQSVPPPGIGFAWALEYDAATGVAELFINGISKGKKTSATHDFASTTGHLLIGATGSALANFANGNAQHVAVYAGLLSPIAIGQLAFLGMGHPLGRDFGLVDVLPAGGVYGDRCTFIADRANGLFWNLVYDGLGSFPWKYVGGPPLIASAAPQRTLTNQTAYTSLATDPLSLTMPLAGDYDMTIEAELWSGTALQNALLSYAIGATAASDAWAILGGLTANVANSASKTTRQTGVTASATIAEKGKTSSTNTGTFQNRRLRVVPVRVG